MIPDELVNAGDVDELVRVATGWRRAAIGTGWSSCGTRRPPRAAAGHGHRAVSAWWAASALTGLLEDFPPDPSEVGDALGELQWWA